MNLKHMDDETRTQRSDIKKNEDKLKNHTFINANITKITPKPIPAKIAPF